MNQSEKLWEKSCHVQVCGTTFSKPYHNWFLSEQFIIWTNEIACKKASGAQRVISTWYFVHHSGVKAHFEVVWETVCKQPAKFSEFCFCSPCISCLSSHHLFSLLSHSIDFRTHSQFPPLLHTKTVIHSLHKHLRSIV